jgi:hypothetical protein
MTATDTLTEALRFKREANITAQLALKGYVLVKLDDGAWCVQKWGLSTSPLISLDAVEDFARQVGAAA